MQPFNLLRYCCLIQLHSISFPLPLHSINNLVSCHHYWISVCSTSFSNLYYYLNVREYRYNNINYAYCIDLGAISFFAFIKPNSFIQLNFFNWWIHLFDCKKARMKLSAHQCIRLACCFISATSSNLINYWMNFWLIAVNQSKNEFN